MSMVIQSGHDTIAPFFSPTTIAVVGAGRHRGSIGTEIFLNLANGGFHGDVFAVNPHGFTVGEIRAWPRVSAIPRRIDLAVVAVPCEAVDEVIDDCITAHVPAIVVISAGFSETGDDGRQHEARIRDKVRRAGIRMIGPNCMGIVNTDPAVQMNATFSPVCPPPGSIGFSSQSGALGLAVLESARRLNLGISSFASIGNKADVSTNDLLEYWETDPRTSAILLYVESFGNPRRFGRIARRVGRTKPIAVVKSGRSSVGARAAASHTGALAASDTAVEALFRKRPTGAPPRFDDLDGPTCRAIVDRAGSTGGGWLDPLSAFALVQACGVATAPIRIVVTAEGALAAARELGYPVVLKGAGPTLLHKTEAGAVHTDLGSDEAVMRAFHALHRHPEVTQIVVQRQIRGGVEMFLGALLDGHFGHMIMCGSGGTLLELLHDTSCRLVPVTDRGAADMVDEIRGKVLLRGYRGAPPGDEAAYRQIILRLSALLQLCPEIEEIDLNPVIVTDRGAFAVDVRVRIAARSVAASERAETAMGSEGRFARIRAAWWLAAVGAATILRCGRFRP